MKVQTYQGGIQSIRTYLCAVLWWRRPQVKQMTLFGVPTKNPAPVTHSPLDLTGVEDSSSGSFSLSLSMDAQVINELSSSLLVDLPTH